MVLPIALIAVLELIFAVRQTYLKGFDRWQALRI